MTSSHRRQGVPPMEAIDQPSSPSPSDELLSPTPDPDDPPPGTPPAPRSLLFGLLSDQPSPRTLPPSSPSLSDGSDPDDGSGSAAPWTDGAEADHWAAAPDDEPQPLRKTSSKAGKTAKLKPVLRRFVTTVTAQVHTALTPAEGPERAHGLWLANEDEAKAIGDPAASILARRMPAGAGNPDVTDGLDLALGVLGYLMRNLQLRAAVRPRYDVVAGEVADDGADTPAT